MSLLVFENVSKTYDEKVILDKVNLRLEKGEMLALIGPNGAGKSTMLKIVLGMETPEFGRAYIAKGVKVGYLSQNINSLDNPGEEGIYNALHHEKTKKLEDRLASLAKLLEKPEGMTEEEYDDCLEKYSRLLSEYENMDGYTVESRIKTTLNGLGLKKEVFTLPVSMLSGGEKMRVALARVLLDEPDLLILDEPTNHLDIEALEWLEDYLRSFDGGVIFVSHDRYFLDRVATRIAELANGYINEKSCNYTQFMEQKDMEKAYSKDRTKTLTREIRLGEELIRNLKSMKRFGAAGNRQKMVDRMRAELEEIRQKSVSLNLKNKGDLKISMKSPAHLSSEVAFAKNLKKTFGDVTLFDDINFLIKGGDRVGIIGPNGCGKTTLINIITGRDTGFDGKAALYSWVKYEKLEQSVYFEDENRFITEEIAAMDDNLKNEDILKLLARVQFFGDDCYKQIKVLSGGERSRLSLLKIIMKQPDCLILDEPTNHLDILARESLEKALDTFKGTIIAISHDRYFLSSSVNRIFDMSGRTLTLYEGNYDDYVDKKAQLAKETLEKKQQDTSKKALRTQKAKEREKESATKKETANYEQMIIDVETEIKKLVESFGPDTAKEDYERYAQLEKDLEELYDNLT